MSEKLKPCPFCGSEVKTEIKTFQDEYGLYNIIYFKCQNKDCKAILSFGNIKSFNNYEYAAKAWNRRFKNDI